MPVTKFNRSHALRGNAANNALRYGTQERSRMSSHGDRGNYKVVFDFRLGGGGTPLLE
jgi:hypothetical protein